MQVGTINATVVAEITPQPKSLAWRQRANGAVISIVLAILGLAILSSGRVLISAGSAALTHAALWWTLAALVMWGLAELISRRSAVPPADIVLAVFFAAFSGLAIYAWLLVAGLAGKAAALTASGTLIAFLAHYYRFRLPFTVFPVALAGWLMAVGLVTIVAHFAAGWSPERDGSLLPAVTLLYGTGLFLHACRLDIRSRAESGTTSERAFWLHLLAGPMVAIPAISNVAKEVMIGAPHPADTAVVVFLLLAFAFISLVVDRAALVAGAVLYLLAIPMISHFQAEQIPWTGLIAGGFGIETAAVALGVFWRPLRRWALGLLPTPWAKWFAPPISDSR
jgi:hypothetical protein